MKLDQYFNTLKGALQENKLTRYVMVGLAFSNAVLAMALFGKNETIVMVPPTLTGEAKLSNNKANASLKESWAAYVVMQLANVTPRTADFVGEQVGKFMSPLAYSGFMQSLAEQTSRIKEDNITIQFSPTHVFYVEEKDIVVISGEYAIRGMRSSEKRSLRTYEVGISISNYQVRIASLNAYEGPWKPMREEEERQKQRLQRQAERNAVASSG